MASDEVQRRDAKPGRERAKGAVALGLVGLVVAFAVLNLDEVSVNWLLGTWRTPLIVVIAASLGVGIAIGALASRRGGKRGD